ncbi:MAG: hypothetical protein M3529_14395 [Actinomycetota bacterium]|nr:hypothetical protein [Actinomycetota bacterium]
MSTENRVDRGDHIEVTEGEPTWDNPTVWSSVRVEYKAGSTAANDETIRQAAANALAGNRAYQALASPTAAQTTVQVRALTAQVNGLARLLLGLLDGTD